MKQFTYLCNMTAEEKFEQAKYKIDFLKRKGKVDCCWATSGRLTPEQIKELEAEGNSVCFDVDNYVTIASWEKANKMKQGNQITILKPVSPHIEGNGTITKVGEGKLKYEVEQWDIKQWYEENQITDRLIKVEPAPEFPKNICDQYKEAISEATEDIKERSKKEVEEQFNQKTYPTNQKESGEMFELIADIYIRQSMCNTTFPNGGISSTGAPFIGGSIVGEPAIKPEQIYGRPFKTCAEIYGNTFMTTEEKEITKRALALLAEQKQSEIKEIEELIKKL